MKNEILISQVMQLEDKVARLTAAKNEIEAELLEAVGNLAVKRARLEES